MDVRSALQFDRYLVYSSMYGRGSRNSECKWRLSG
jgi:hypothetical protein